jgi:GNAT superfamily N-acetyltransferase
MLTNHQIESIRNLMLICEEHDHISLKLNFDLLEQRKNGEIRDFFHYENDSLVGFIGLYGFGNTVEMCGMVHPHFRRKKIFTALYCEARKLIKGLPFSKILLNVPDKSASGIGFLETLPATLSFSEYQMKWIPCDLPPLKSDVTLRFAQSNDLAFINHLNKVCFQSTHPLDELSQTSVNRTYIIEKDGVPSGKVSIVREEKQSWICGLAIEPSYQQKGLGSETIRIIVSREYSEGQELYLEVSPTNKQAMTIYFKNGFQTFNAQHYFEIKK